ncbi:COG1615 family transporter, partial [Streptomyces sp. SID7982]|nr:COG1615 family transporter [Streptomyces sp. SID7982]
FYAFDLPWYRFMLGFGFAATVLSLIAAALTHYLYGGLRITSPGARATGAATGHLSVLLGIFVSLKAVAYWLDRYGLAVKSSDFKATDNWTGLRYVDANAYLPAKTILFCIAAICAVLFFATLWRRTWQ